MIATAYDIDAQDTTRHPPLERMRPSRDIPLLHSCQRGYLSLCPILFDRGIFTGDGSDPERSANDRILVLLAVRRSVVGECWFWCSGRGGSARPRLNSPRHPHQTPPGALMGTAANPGGGSFGSSSRGLVKCVQEGVRGSARCSLGRGGATVADVLF